MMTTKTARDIFYEYPYIPAAGPMPEYVPVEEYEALRAILQQWRVGHIEALFKHVGKPDVVFHLAANVGGIQYNTQKIFLAKWAEYGGQWCVAEDVEDVMIALGE